MKKFISPEAGFSLVQGMIIAAILAASALVATRLLSDQKMAQKSMETRDQIEDLHAIIYSTLQKRENCEATFTGNLASPVINTLKGAPAIDPIANIRLPITGEIVARTYNGTLDVTDTGRNTYMNGNVLIRSMNLTYAELPNSTANLEIVYERLSNEAGKRTKAGYGAKTIKKNITIRVQRNPFDLPNKAFVSCYALTTDKSADGSSEIGNDINEEFCTEMNNGLTGDGTTTGINVFLWDPSTNTCIPNSKCPDHLTYTGFTATGTVICKSLPQLFQESVSARPTFWSTLYTGTTGSCGPNKTIRIIAAPDAKSFSINCN